MYRAATDSARHRVDLRASTLRAGDLHRRPARGTRGGRRGHRPRRSWPSTVTGSATATRSSPSSARTGSRSYEAAADDIAAAGVDAVLIQHEYGIFGGPNGSYVLHLARALTRRGIPYLVTLHTLLSQPTAGQAATLSALCAGAARVTVFTETARRMAIRAGVAAGHQLTVVPHGAPEILRTDRAATSRRHPRPARHVRRRSGAHHVRPGQRRQGPRGRDRGAGPAWCGATPTPGT